MSEAGAGPRPDPTSPTDPSRDLDTVAKELAVELNVLVGLTTLTEDGPTPCAWSSPRAKLAEEIQLISESAPNQLSLRAELPVTVPDLTLETRWPDCRTQLRLLGLRALHCRPLITPHVTAVLDLYADHPHAFDLGTLPAIDRACREIAALFADELR